MKWYRGVPVVALMVGVMLSACADEASLADPAFDRVDPGQAAAVVSGAESRQARLDALAGAVARATGDVTVRDELFRAFGASQAPEGKVLLHRAARTGTLTGYRLAAHFAPVGGLERALEHLPPLDFYVGRQRDRAALPLVGHTVAVVAVMDPDQRTATAFYSDGRVDVVGGPDEVEADVLLLIHPTEQLLESGCDPETAIIPCDEGYGGGYSSGDPTWVDDFEVNFGDWWGDSEVDFRGWGYCGTSLQAWDNYTRYEVQAYTVYDGGTMIPGWSPALCPGNGRVYVELWELDDWLGGGDDYFGSAQWYQNERGAQKSFIFYDPNGWATVSWTLP